MSSKGRYDWNTDTYMKKTKKTIIDNINQVTISFDTGKEFTFYRTKNPQYFKMAEQKVHKKYKGIQIKVYEPLKTRCVYVEVW